MMSDTTVGHIVVASGSLQMQRSHLLESPILESSLHDFESLGTTFAINAIRDETIRRQYVAHINEISGQVRQDVKNGNLTAKEGAEYCSKLRDKLFVEYRKYTSTVGVKLAGKLKLSTRGYDFYLNKYGQQRFGKDFIALSEQERHVIYYTVLEKAGSGNESVTTGTRVLKIFAKVFILITALIVAGTIINAEQKTKEAARQGSIIAGGILGGRVAGIAASFICGPAEIICATLIVIIGAHIGSVTSEAINDISQEEIALLRRWTSGQ